MYTCMYTIVFLQWVHLRIDADSSSDMELISYVSVKSTAANDHGMFWDQNLVFVLPSVASEGGSLNW